MATLTLNEVLKGLANERVNATYVAQLFNPFRHQLIADYYNGISGEDLAKELSAFDSDTHNGTCKVVIAASTKVNDNGQLLDEDGNVLENAVSFATVTSTNKEGETVKVRPVFRCSYVGDTVQRNISIVASWLEYRQTVANSFAYMKQLDREKTAKRVQELTAMMTAAMLAGNFEAAQELREQILALQK